MSSYKALKDQLFRYMSHVLKNVGGSIITTRSEGSSAEVYALLYQLATGILAFFNTNCLLPLLADEQGCGGQGLRSLPRPISWRT